MNFVRSYRLGVILTIAAMCGWAARAWAQGTAFTYQGELRVNGVPATGTFDLQFELFDAASNGTPVAFPLVVEDVSVAGGVFTVTLDFGTGAFPGSPRWLQIGARDGNSTDDFTVLSPRQALTAVPYAQRAGSAPWEGLTGVPSGFADNTDDDTQYSAGSGLVLSGTEFRAQGSPYANIAVVAKSGGDFTSIGAALAGIDNATSRNRWLIFVAPGYYEERFTMKPFVDIEGASETAVVIASSFMTNDQNTGVVIASNDASLRRLTIEAAGGGVNTSCLRVNGTSPLVQNVTLRNLNLTSGFALFDNGNNAVYEHLTIEIDGPCSVCYGIWTFSNSSIYRQVRLTIPVQATALKVNGDGDFDGLWIEMPNGGIGINLDSGSLVLRNADIRIGGAVARGIYAFGNLSLMDVHIETSVSNDSIGIFNQSSNSNLINVRVISSGGILSKALQNRLINSSHFLAADCMFEARGSGTNAGVENLSFSIVAGRTYNVHFNNCVIEAGGGTSNIGVNNSDAIPQSVQTIVVNLNNCEIIGSTNTIKTDTEFMTRAGGCLMDGGSVSGVVTCAGCFDENYVFSPSTCP
ncbi:MAG: hypothetical protein Kow0059_19360 [Candidatus Sumerlaeia bacterium]